jgi:hypothetical protein
MSDWTGQRARFNHDRLKNQFLQSVARLVRALEGRTRDEDFVAEFLTKVPDSWEELEREALDLLRRADVESGPSAWFRCNPLSRLPVEDRRWMEASLSREWHCRPDRHSALNSAFERLVDVRENCLKLVAILRSSSAGSGAGTGDQPHERASITRAELLRAAVALHRAGQRLSEAFHDLSPADPISFLAQADRQKRL